MVGTGRLNFNLSQRVDADWNGREKKWGDIPNFMEQKVWRKNKKNDRHRWMRNGEGRYQFDVLWEEILEKVSTILDL
jgi:hypothetical protein